MSHSNRVRETTRNLLFRRKSQQMDEGFEARFSRLMDLIFRLRASEGHTAEKLSRIYGISRRTIHRDLLALRAAQFPIEDMGRGRGYRLHPDFKMPTQLLSSKDVLSLIAGGRIIGGLDPYQALAKVRNWLTNGLERKLADELPSRIVPLELTGKEWLEPISIGIAEKRQIQVAYNGKSRILEPATLFVRQGTWYVDAFEDKWKTFRLDRFDSVEVSQRPQAQARRPSEEAPFHPWDIGDEETTVLVQVGGELSAWLRTNPAHPSQILEGNRVSYTFRNPDAFLRWLLGLTEAKLLSPKGLIESLRNRLTSCLKIYEESGGGIG